MIALQVMHFDNQVVLPKLVFTRVYLSLCYSQAAEDSLRQMGNRVFYDQILQDTIRQRQCPITDEIDVTTLKDYMQVFCSCSSQSTLDLS